MGSVRSVQVLRDPSESNISKYMKKIQIEILNYLNPSPYPCLLRTLHMKSSRGRPCSSLLATFPLPVVCPYSPNTCLQHHTVMCNARSRV